jgi:hypothetical protein
LTGAFRNDRVEIRSDGEPAIANRCNDLHSLLNSGNAKRQEDALFVSNEGDQAAGDEQLFVAHDNGQRPARLICAIAGHIRQ